MMHSILRVLIISIAHIRYDLFNASHSRKLVWAILMIIIGLVN